MLTSPAADTWACLRFPTMLTSRLSATENDVLAPRDGTILNSIVRGQYSTRQYCYWQNIVLNDNIV